MVGIHSIENSYWTTTSFDFNELCPWILRRTHTHRNLSSTAAIFRQYTWNLSDNSRWLGFKAKILGNDFKISAWCLLSFVAFVQNHHRNRKWMHESDTMTTVSSHATWWYIDIYQIFKRRHHITYTFAVWNSKYGQDQISYDYEAIWDLLQIVLRI